MEIMDQITYMGWKEMTHSGIRNDTLDGGTGQILCLGDGDDIYIVDNNGDTFENSGGN